MIGLSILDALVLSTPGPLSLYVRDGAWVRLEVSVDPLSTRHGITTKAVAAQAEDALKGCGHPVDPGATSTILVLVRGAERKDEFVATVMVRARHQSVVNGSMLTVDLYEDEKTVPGPAGEEAAKVKAHLTRQLQILCGDAPLEPANGKAAK